nr:PREDICTED: C-X-C chemokine receptor type 3-like isoform X1 [Anolis carolinensis]XP_008121510.1 PREDICTED: C-X-C chemokine receptor type 3-like isoform X2 [Anolis carolinensis]|eukprot:XP_008121509.1 PREDICTED: C-X-C chemokine receptor type 3-like isoform X1 [Anolis carolinensis]
MDGDDAMVLTSGDLFDLVGNSSDGYYDYDNWTDACCSSSSVCNSNATQGFSGSFLPAFYSLICLLGLWGNGMVIAVLLRAKEALAGTDVFLFNLAVADILLVLTLPFWAVQEARGWVFGTFLCRVVGGAFKINFFASIFFLVCISLDRYLSIVCVVRMYRRSKASAVHLTAVAVWVACLLLTVPDFVYLSAEYDSRQKSTSCSLVFPPDSATQWKVGLSLFNQVGTFFLPLLAMGYCYAHIVFTLLLSKGFRKHKALRVILAVVGAFFLCWLPYHSIQFATTFLKLDCAWQERLEVAEVVATALGFFHCCLNPLLYAFMGVKFQHRYLELLQKLGCVNHGFVARYSRQGSALRRESTWSESTETTYSGGF